VLALFLCARGHLAPELFARAVVAVYLAGLLSQLLASAPVITRAGLAPFALAQALVAWCWLCLHAKRLRDAGEGTDTAVAVALLYALAVLLLVLVLVLALVGDPFAEGANGAPGMRPAKVFVLFLPLAMLTSSTNLGLFDYVIIAALLLVALTVAVAIGFSVASFRRPRAVA
jgi:hypothetical protein